MVSIDRRLLVVKLIQAVDEAQIIVFIGKHLALVYTTIVDVIDLPSSKFDLSHIENIRQDYRGETSISLPCPLRYTITNWLPFFISRSDLDRMITALLNYSGTLS